MLYYLLRTTTMGVEQVTRSVAISIPAGTVLRICEDCVNGTGLVDAEWDGKSVQVFAVDIRDRGEFDTGTERLRAVLQDDARTRRYEKGRRA